MMLHDKLLDVIEMFIGIVLYLLIVVKGFYLYARAYCYANHYNFGLLMNNVYYNNGLAFVY